MEVRLSIIFLDAATLVYGGGVTAAAATLLPLGLTGDTCSLLFLQLRIMVKMMQTPTITPNNTTLLTEIPTIAAAHSPEPPRDSTSANCSLVNYEVVILVAYVAADAVEVREAVVLYGNDTGNTLSHTHSRKLSTLISLQRIGPLAVDVRSEQFSIPSRAFLS